MGGRKKDKGHRGAEMFGQKIENLWEIRKKKKACKHMKVFDCQVENIVLNTVVTL